MVHACIGALCMFIIYLPLNIISATDAHYSYQTKDPFTYCRKDLLKFSSHGIFKRKKSVRRQSTKTNLCKRKPCLKLKLKSKIDKEIKPICCRDYKETGEAPK